MTELPSGWAEVRTDEAGTLDLGRQRSPKYHSGPNMKPYLRVANVFEDRIDTSDVKTMHFEPEAFERSKLHIGDVLLNEGQSPEWLGRPAIYRGDPPDVAFTNSLIRFKPNAAVTSEWALTVFRHHMHSGRFTRESRITTNIAHLSASRLAAVEFRVPPLVEQERIVAVIEEAFSKLDAGEAGLRTVRQLLKRMREATLLAAVTGGLCQLSGDSALGDRELESLRETSAAERRLGRRAGRTKDSDVPVPGVSLPAGWRWVRWSQVGHCQNGRAFPSSDYRDHGVPLLRPGNLAADGHVRWTESNTRYLPEQYASSCADLLVGPSEVVMNLTAQSLKDDFLGRACITGAVERCLLNQRLARLTPFATSPAFALLFFRSPLFRDFVKTLNTGSLIQHMYTHQVDSCWIPLPPSADQEAAVAEADRCLSVIDNFERVVEAAAEQGATLRRSVLKAAFELRLVPQDPSDEPASVLLERIRAERAPSDGSGGGRRRKKVEAS